MNWGEPQALWCLLILLPLLALWLAGERRFRQRLALWQAQRPRRLGRRTILALALRLCAVLSLIIALAQPRWNFSWQDVKRQGADLVIALDVSRSMLATDVMPSRLERAKREIKDLLALSKGDRLALVIYSGAAFIQCPLTHDLDTFELFLDHASPESLPVAGTSLSEALMAAAKAIDEGAEGSSRGRAVILISDGEDHDGRAIEVAQQLAARGITLHTIGVGGQGAPIPQADGGFLKDAKGQMVVSHPNEAILRSLANVGKGRFVRAANGDFDLARTYRSFIRPDLGVSEQHTREKVWDETHFWFSALAALLLAGDSILTLAWRRGKKTEEARGGNWRMAN